MWPVKQVQIEARIVTIDEGDIDELGVRLGYFEYRWQQHRGWFN